MANEYRITNLSADVFGPRESSASFYSLGVDILYYSIEPIQISNIGVDVFRTIMNKSEPLLLDDTSDSDDAFNPQLYVDAINPGLEWSETEDFPGFKVLAWLITDPDIPVEWNPHSQAVPVTLADSDPESYDFQREQAEILREQHNLTQAGDTTFPWEMMFKTTATKEYNVGSISRFFHPTYGVFLARYVKFSPRWSGSKQVPVGHDEKYKADSDWTVVDDPAKSAWQRLVGVSLPFETDIADKFGWVLVQGRGLFEFFVNSPILPEPYRIFTWGEIGFGTFGPGLALGHVIDGQYTREYLDEGESFDPKRWRLQPGSWAVDVEGVTEEYITGIATIAFGALDARVTALENAPAPEVVDYSGQIGALETATNALRASLTQEINTRYNADRSLQERVEAIEAVTDGGGGTTLGDFFILQDRVTALESLQIPRIDDLADANALVQTRLGELEAWRISVDSQLAGISSIPGSILTDPSLIEMIQDTVGAMVINGTDIVVTYDDTAGTLEIESTASGGGGGAEWTLIDQSGNPTTGSTWTYSSAVAQVDVVGLSGWNELLIIGRTITASASGIRAIRVSTDNGATFYATTSDYIELANTGAGGAATSVLLGHNTATTLGRNIHGHILNLKGPQKMAEDLTGKKLFVGSPSDINAIRLFNASSGNLTGGDLYVFAR